MKKRYSFFIVLSLLVIILVSLISYKYWQLLKDTEGINKYLIFIVLTIIVVSLFSIIIYQGKYIKKVSLLEKRLDLWNTITYHVKGAGEIAFNELPIGIIIFDNLYNITWSNNEAKNYLFSELNNFPLKSVANGVLYDFILADKEDEDKILSIYDDIYQVKYVKKHNILYLTKTTSYENLKKRYKDHTLAIGYINVENFEEALVDLDVQEKTDFSGEVIKTIAEWANKYDAYVRTLSETKYLLITDDYHLGLMEKDKFTLLDEIKLIVCNSKSILISLSVGIMCDDLPINALSDGANEQFDMAENRGGDQVVVMNHGRLSFYGAKTDPTRKISKVDNRFKYQELEILMSQASKIFCIGHTNQDADAFGASVGIYNLGIAIGKPTYIILDPNHIDNTVRKVYHDVEKLHPSLFASIIYPHQALKLIDEKSLLIVVDCQAESNLFVSRDFIYRFNRIGIIDHHRKNEDGTINDVDYLHCDPGASSSVELIVGLLEFSEQNLMISSLEATWMMLGIIIDTNNFVYRTTSVTFEVASWLNGLQANISICQNYLKEDINEKLIRNNLIAKTEYYRSICALAIQDVNDKTMFEPASLAKVSDELLKISDIELAVTVAHSDDNTIRISSRSLGRINCQVLMEKLGGGGHLTGAACTIKNKSIDEIVLDLKKAIDEILKSTEGITKVILIKKIKNVGVRGTIIEVSFEQAQKWLEQGLVVVATFDNLRIFEQEKEEAQAIIDSSLKKYRDLKELLETKSIYVNVKISKDGIIKNSDVISEIIKYCRENANIHLNANQIAINQVINSYGIYPVKITITSDIIADAKVAILDKY